MDNARPNTDLFDGSDRVAHLNHVTDFDRSLEEHDQAGHKIVNYVLQTEPDADAECSGQDREFCHIHAQCR